MISTNTNSDKLKHNKCVPLKLNPIGKDYIWGGTRLREEYGKPIDLTPFAESWECSVHPDGMSTITGGIYNGLTLQRVLEEHPDFIGSHPDIKNGFPILVKLIDANSDLSVQVHPNDEYAMKHEQQLGKTEMWYVLDADPGAQLIYGFSHEVNKELMRKNISNHQLMDYLQYMPVRKGDVFFIEPGTIHAIGGGVLIAEIQESSNVTYRVFDYGRTDKEGKQRELHVEKALEVLNMQVLNDVRQPMRVTRFYPGYSKELLCRCQYFQVERVNINGVFIDNIEDNSFQVYLVARGKGSVTCGEEIRLNELDTLFLPADIGKVEVRGTLELLKIGC